MWTIDAESTQHRPSGLADDWRFELVNYRENGGREALLWKNQIEVFVRVVILHQIA